MEENKKKFAESKVPRDEMRSGKEVELDGKVYIVPALSLKQLRTFAVEIKKISEQGDTDGLESLAVFDMAVPVITRAMGRNYPDLTEDTVAEIVDLGAFPAVFDAVLGAQGLLKGEILGAVAARQKQ